jgi:hypothetical protein
MVSATVIDTKKGILKMPENSLYAENASFETDSMKKWSSWWNKRCGVFLPIKTTTGGPRDVIPWNRSAQESIDGEFTQ